MGDPIVSESGSNGNGHKPGMNGTKQVKVQEKGNVAVVDVEQRRYDDVELILNRLVGQEESFALAKMSRYKRQGVSIHQTLVNLYKDQGVDLDDMKRWGLDLVKGDLQPQKSYERAIDNLTKQGGEKPGFLEKWIGRDK